MTVRVLEVPLTPRLEDRIRLGGRAVLVAVCVLLPGCSFLGKQLAISSANDCIEKECSDEHGTAHQQCMTSCQRAYGP